MSEQVAYIIIAGFVGLFIGLLPKVFGKNHETPCPGLGLVRSELEKHEKAINEQFGRLRTVEQEQAKTVNDGEWVRQILNEIRHDIKELKAKANE